MLTLIWILAGYDLSDAEFFHPHDYALPPQDASALATGAQGGVGGGTSVAASYPQTDAQYSYLHPSSHATEVSLVLDARVGLVAARHVVYGAARHAHMIGR